MPLFGNAYLLLALAALCWSGNHVIGRAAAEDVPAFGISTARWFFGGLLIWPLAHSHLVRDWPVVRQHWKPILFLASTGGALFSALQYLGLQHTTALNVSVLNSLAPVFIVAAGAAIFRDRLSPIQAFGIATSLTGVLVIVTRADAWALAAFQFNLGDLIIVFNMAVMAVYSACLRLTPRIHWLSFLFIIAVVSALGTAPLYLWEHLSGLRFQPTLLALGTVVYVSIFPSVVAFAAYNRGIELIGANRAGAFTHLIPLYSAVLATVFLGERLMAYHVLGFALILAGVWFAARRW